MPRYEEGLYAVQVMNQGISKIEKEDKEDTRYFFLEVEPYGKLDPEDKSKMTPVQSEVRVIQLWLTDAAIEYTIKQLEELGWDGASFTDLEGDIFNKKEIEAHCEYEQGEGGKVYERWNLPRIYVPRKVDEGAGKDLDAVFAKHLKRKQKS